MVSWRSSSNQQNDFLIAGEHRRRSAQDKMQGLMDFLGPRVHGVGLQRDETICPHNREFDAQSGADLSPDANPKEQKHHKTVSILPSRPQELLPQLLS
jgi:hypothetical protein